MDLASLVTERTDLVGFLPIGRTLKFTGGEFRVLEDFQTSLTAINEQTNVDHYLYPPTQTRQTAEFIDAKTGRPIPEENLQWVDVPHTERPALLHHLPPSHLLALDAPALSTPLRESEGGFLMHLVGYLFGYRMQFYDWRFDGRILLKKSAHRAVVRRSTVSPFLSQAYSAWRAWPAGAQKRMTNALYMLGRAPTHEWDWEQFVIYYMVFDALYRVANDVFGVAEKAHAKRLSTMCNRFGLYQNQGHFDLIVGLRNDLFHETLWGGSQPGTGISEEKIRQVLHLRRINERLIPALLGFKTDYVASGWDHGGWVGF